MDKQPSVKHRGLFLFLWGFCVVGIFMLYGIIHGIRGAQAHQETLLAQRPPIPGGSISGRVYLMDRDKPVLTTIKLMRGQPRTPSTGGLTSGSRFKYSDVDSTVTDENGNYSFVVVESGSYAIEISVTDLL